MSASAAAEVEQKLARFAGGYPFQLDEYQLKACRELARGAGVLVAAPTGAGKTVVGEFACWAALQGGSKCFYTTPIKALSNQKYHDLVERHGADQVGLLTGDISINGEAPLVVMTTEVLRNMIYAGSHTLSGLGYVVMDEVHYLADRFRGPVWEEVILGLAESVQLVALSATVSNAEEFGEWLDEVRGGVSVVVSETRPVPLTQHVMVGRQLHDLFTAQGQVNPTLLKVQRAEARTVRDDARRPRGRTGRGRRTVSYGSGAFGGAASRQGGREEQLIRPPSRAQVVAALKAADLLPAIVFTFSRQGCEGAVRQLLGSGVRLTSRTEQAELAEIAERHTQGMDAADLQALDWESFRRGLLAGVAAHHAGMLPTFKAIVEEGFTRGLIKVVHATETLALGINMPARTVVIEKLVKFNGESHADITPGEFTQLTGRAGRRGIDVHGHAVVLWQPGMDARAVAGLASRRTYPLRSSFAPTYNMAVNLIGTIGRDRARSLLEQSFAQFQTDRSVVAMARQARGRQAEIDQWWRQASCELGDFAGYARLRDQISGLESEIARLRRTDRRAETIDSLLALEPGDIAWVPAGRHRGWVAVIDPGLGRDSDPHPLVMTRESIVQRLSISDFPEPTRVASRVRVPRHFDPRSVASRKALASSFRQRLSTLDPELSSQGRGKRDEVLTEQVNELRARLREHPCQHCPDREVHARAAEQALRAERELTGARTRAESRVLSIATRFDRLCTVLASLGYLTEQGERLTPAGELLARIYNELDLVVAECIREGVLDALDTAQLAAVLSSLVYESRLSEDGRPVRMPDRVSEAAQSRVREQWRRIGQVERDNRVERGRAPDIGFAEAGYAWAAGEPFAQVLEQTGLPPGDVVRWIRQVIDLAAQISLAPDVGELRGRCRQVVLAMRRGIVDFDVEQD